MNQGATSQGSTPSLRFGQRFLGLTRDLFLVVEGGVVREANDAWSRVLGWGLQQLGEMPLRHLFHGKELPLIEEQAGRCLNGHGWTDVEARVRTAQGDDRWMAWTGCVEFPGGPLLLIGRDIHTKKESDAFAKLFFEAASVGLNLCAMDGTWIESNPSFLRMIGYSKEEANGKLTYWQLTPRKYDAEEQVQLRRLKEEGRYGPYEKEFVRSDGTLVPVRLNGFLIQMDGKPFIWSIIEDISHERLLQSEIRKKNALFEAIVENIPVALFIKDGRDDFRVTLWNAMAEAVFGCPRAEVVGKTFQEIWPGARGAGTWEADQKVIDEGQLVELEEQGMTRPEGNSVLLHTKKVPLRFLGEAGSDLVLSISEDITERKRLEADLRGAIAARDDFLSVASHELKTPLTALSLQLQVLHRLLGDDRVFSRERAMVLARKAEGIGRQINGLLNDLLDMTRIRAGKLALNCTRVDLAEVVDRVVTMMAEPLQQSGSVVRVTQKTAVWGYWDPNRIHEVVANLLSNAIKFGGGKPIDVSIDFLAAEQQALLSIRDFGIGIPKDRQSGIFERFDRGAASDAIAGWGLGLYIAKKVVEAHGGAIGVESSPGEGSVFFLRLPVALGPSAAKERAAVGADTKDETQEHRPFESQPFRADATPMSPRNGEVPHP